MLIMKSLNNTSSLWTNLHVEELEKREEYTGVSSIGSINPECCDFFHGCCDYCNNVCFDYSSCTDSGCCDLHSLGE